MSETTFHPDDPLFRVSRGLDNDLSVSERRRLEATLAESEAMREQADELRAADRLIRRWAKSVVELDWEPHAELVRARLAPVGDDESREVDGLLARWARPVAIVDAETFTAGVLAKIQPPKPQVQPPPWVYRWGVPLAAAAALGMALTATSWFTATGRPVTLVEVGPRVSMATRVASVSEEPRVVVSFVRTADASATPSGSTTGISIAAIGASPLPPFVSEGAPL